MRILFDNGTPRGVASALPGHVVEEARLRGWDTDRNIRYQQNLTGRKIAIVVLGRTRWRLIKARFPEIAAAVSATTPGSFTEVEIPAQ
jgi:hypothetical protein